MRFGPGDAANRTLNFLRFVRANGQHLLDELPNARPAPKPGHATSN
jgi:hypothetical protein